MSEEYKIAIDFNESHLYPEEEYFGILVTKLGKIEQFFIKPFEEKDEFKKEVLFIANKYPDATIYLNNDDSWGYLIVRDELNLGHRLYNDKHPYRKIGWTPYKEIKARLFLTIGQKKIVDNTLGYLNFKNSLLK